MTKTGDDEMLQAVRGYFKEGRFVSSHLDAIPDYVEVYVTIFKDMMFHGFGSNNP